MQRKHFIDWLTQRGQKANVAASRATDCARVERKYGVDLDSYSSDAFAALLKDFEYSTEDQRAGRPVRHQVPIEGNQYTGTATLKAALRLYRDFRLAGEPPKPSPKPPSGLPKPTFGNWPQWELLSEEDSLLLARVLARHARFLKPEIVRTIAQDNERHGDSWRAELNARGVPANAYLWEGSPCAFPGVRRYAGNEEIAIYRGRKASDGKPPEGALQLDDNDYPKHLWSHLFLGKPFQKKGPPGYNLAHLADHKDHGNRAATDFDIAAGLSIAGKLHGLYTCPTNTIYLPAGLLKPTDFHAEVRGLFIRKVQALYAGVCNIVPPFMAVHECKDSNWDIDRFDWAEPVGDPTQLTAFLKFRALKMEAIFKQSALRRKAVATIDE